MITIRYVNDYYECYKASKTEHDVYLFDENNKIIKHFSNIYGSEWDCFSIEDGEWTNYEDVPSYEDTIRADLDYCLMLMDETIQEID